MSAELGCNDLKKMSETISNLRIDLMFGFDDTSMEAIAEQHYLLALSALEQAHIQMKLAHIHQMRAMV